MTTPSFIDMDRIEQFLRPQRQGGMGAGKTAWIAYCLNLSPERTKAALDALCDQGVIHYSPDFGDYRYGEGLFQPPRARVT